MSYDQSMGPLRSAAAGISTYIRFCKMANNGTFQPSSGIIRKWSAPFNHGKTFGLYINHVRKATILLNCDDGWLTSEIRLIARFLRGELDRSFPCQNFARSVDLFEIIDREGKQSTFGMVDYLPYMFHHQSSFGPTTTQGRL